MATLVGKQHPQSCMSSTTHIEHPPTFYITAYPDIQQPHDNRTTTKERSITTAHTQKYYHVMLFILQAAFLLPQQHCRLYTQSYPWSIRDAPHRQHHSNAHSHDYQNIHYYQHGTFPTSTYTETQVDTLTNPQIQD